LDSIVDSLARDIVTKDSRRVSWVVHQKQVLASKASNSKIGKTILKKILDKQTVIFIEVLQKVATSEFGETKAKKNMRKDVTKAIVKVLVLVEDKKLNELDFRGILYHFRRVCAIIRNSYQNNSLNSETAIKLESLIKQLDITMNETFKGLVSSNTLARMSSALQTLAAAKFLENIFKSEDFGKIIVSCAHFLDLMRSESSSNIQININ